MKKCTFRFRDYKMRSNIDNNKRIYNNELKINNNDIKTSAFPVILHKEYKVDKTASAKHIFSFEMKEKYVLSEDKKTLLSWNMVNVQLGDSVDYGVCIPEGVENIADGAFSGCDKIFLVIFPKSLKRIGNWAFAGTLGFKAIFKCEQLEVIGEYAFYGCCIHMEKGLDNLPKSIKKIDGTSFKDCRIYSRFQGQYYSVNMKKIDTLWYVNLLPKEIKPEINFETELNRDSLLDSSKEDEYGVVYDSSYTYILECKNKDLNTYKVKTTTIGILQNSFADLENLTEIDLSNTQHIGDYAFCGCKKLSVIKIGNCLKTIGKCAFSNTGLQKLNLPVSLVKMDSAVFENCKELEEVQINCSLERIPEKSFNSCSALHTVIFRKTIKILDRLSFAGCSSLKDLKLPNGIRQLGDLCFAYCTFKSIDLPRSLIIMNYSPFCGCKNVNIVSESPFFYANEKFLLGYNRTRLISYLGEEKNIVIPGSVREILGYSLCNRSSDSKIFLPDSVNIIGHWAFRSACAECINFPKSLFYIKSSFDYCGYIKTYMINDSQKEYLQKITMYNKNLIVYQ